MDKSQKTQLQKIQSGNLIEFDPTQLQKIQAEYNSGYYHYLSEKEFQSINCL